MKILFRVSSIAAFCLLLSSFADGQNPVKMSDSELRLFLEQAGKKTIEYSEAFKNLSAEETKTFETFDKDGTLAKRKKILSDFIVYEAGGDAAKNGLIEYHNVREVDGKTIKDSDKRALKLFAAVADANSFEKELQKIKKESLRYDKGIRIYGVAAAQGFPLISNLLSSFKFEDAGRENIDGNAVIVVKYQQISSNPAIKDEVDASDFLGISNIFRRGTLWLDAQNQKIRRMKDEMTIDSPGFAAPVVLVRQDYIYQSGDFGIYPPVKIIVENYSPVLNKQVEFLLKNTKTEIKTRLLKRVTFEYKNFRWFEITVKVDK